MRTKDPVKIQINSLEALERLVGGDPQLEFDIRNNVVQKFAAKHLKAIANSEMMKRLEKQLTDMVWKKGHYGYNSKQALTEGFKKSVEQQADKLLRGIINDKIQTLTREIEKSVSTQLDSVADKIINELTSTKVREIVNRKVDNKLKTILKLLVEQDDPQQQVQSIKDL